MTYKSLKEYTNEELISFLDQNQTMEMSRLGPVCAEILKRMNKEKYLFSKQQPLKED